MRISVFCCLFVFLLFGCNTSKKIIEEATPQLATITKDTIRFASYNVSMFRNREGILANELSNPTNPQVQRVAAVIQEVQPDILALMEFDYDRDSKALALFKHNFLEISQNGNSPISYKYACSIVSNTGVLSEVDLSGDGKISLPDDAYGFGKFPGQYAFALLSKYPIDIEHMRSFQKFLWKDIPHPLLPSKADGSSYYSDEALKHFRISSKNHVDIPIALPKGQTVHVLLMHPTPPVFDGSEDRNGKRNHDEIRLMADYISNKAYLIDDKGIRGGLASGQNFVIMGDLNADPLDGDSADKAIWQLLNHPAINHDLSTGDKIPSSLGGAEFNQKPNDKGDPAYDTSFFGLHIDYILPSTTFDVLRSGVFWPPKANPLHALIQDKSASDHLCIWADLIID